MIERGRKCNEAWKVWRDSIEGRSCASARTLHLHPDQDRYLHNRLELAFIAGFFAAGNALTEWKRTGGRKGGIARARALSPERRSEIARMGAEARWRPASPAERTEPNE